MLWSLIIVHEYGHYLAARLLKVRVNVFSIGFGRALISKTGRSGTEYRLAWLPLGGYVQLHHTPADQFDPEAFNHSAKWKRFLILMAGILMNLWLAGALFWATYMIGYQEPKALIKEILPESIAASAGLKAPSQIIAADNKRVDSWSDAIMILIEHLGNSNPLKLEILHRAEEIPVALDLSHWHLAGNEPDLLRTLGIKAVLPLISNQIGKISANSPAMQSGLKTGDRILAIDGKETPDWEAVLAAIQQAKSTLQLTIVHQGETLNVSVHPATRWQGLKRVPYLGVMPVEVHWDKDQLVERQYPVTAAWWEANKKLWQLAEFNSILLGKLLTGKLPVSTLSGPIGIFNGSNQALAAGWTSFMRFVAFISFMLAFINLLPFPGLDGGQLLFLLIETSLQKPIPLAWQHFLIRISFILLIILLVQVTLNDISHLICTHYASSCDF